MDKPMERRVMKAWQATVIVGLWIATAVTANGQQTSNCFLTDFAPKSAVVPPFEVVDKITSGTTLYVNVNATDTLAPISKYIFGNAVAVWVAQNQNNPTLVGHMKKLAPTLVRYPGGSWSDIYFWNGNPGDLPDSIPDGQNNGVPISLYAQFGPYLSLTPSEYYKMCQSLNAQGLITINYGYARYGLGGNPAERAAHLAADWVRYDNGRTRFWEIGNENGGPWEAGFQIDTTKNKDGQPKIITGELYGKHFRIFADSMRAAAAQIGATIYIGGQVLHYDGTASWNPPDRTWNEGFFKQAGTSPDFYVMHNYFKASNSTNATTLLNFANSEVAANANFILSDATAKGAPQRPIALTEYNMGTSYATEEASFIKGMQAVLLYCEMAKNRFGLGARWLAVNYTDGMFYDGPSTTIPKYNPQPEFFYAYYAQKFIGDHLVSASVPGTSQIVAYASTFASGHLGVIVVNKGKTTNTALLTPSNFGFGDHYYAYTLRGGTDNGDFSNQVFVNDEGPSAPDLGGPPIATIDSLKAYAYPIENDEIKFSIPPRSVEFILLEPGNHVITGVKNDQALLPTEFALEQNYPNPFNPTTVVSSQLPVASHVRIVVYDLLGREVKVLMDENKDAGRHEVTWDATGCASGVYICRMTAGSSVESIKMVLTR
jgi:hypothetical protein